MENTLENEMLDAAISWCDSNGINVLEPEQLSHLVNSLYVTVCDAALDTAQPVQVNAVLVEALKALLSWVDAYAETSDAEFPDIEAKAEAALTAAQQAQPERAPLTKDERTLLFADAIGFGDESWQSVNRSDLDHIVEKVEAAHGIKQGGQ